MIRSRATLRLEQNNARTLLSFSQVVALTILLAIATSAL
jgi:hypothetical protein